MKVWQNSKAMQKNKWKGGVRQNAKNRREVKRIGEDRIKLVRGKKGQSTEGI